MFSKNTNFKYGDITTDYAEFITYLKLILDKYSKIKNTEEFIYDFLKFKINIEKIIYDFTIKNNINYIYNEYYFLSKIFLDIKINFNEILKLNICEDETSDLCKYIFNLNLLSENLNQTKNNLYIKNKEQKNNYFKLDCILDNL